MKELFEDETLKDLDIKVRGDKIVRCHRYVLAATSSKWEQLLNSSQGMLLQNYLVFSFERELRLEIFTLPIFFNKTTNQG